MKIRSSGLSKLWLDKVLNYRGGWKTAARQLNVVDFRLQPGLPQGGALSSATYRIAVRYLSERDVYDDEDDEIFTGYIRRGSMGSIGSGAAVEEQSLRCNSRAGHSSSADRYDTELFAINDGEVGELSWFVKFPPAVFAGDGSDAAAVAEDRRHRLRRAGLMARMGMFEREHSFYERLLPAMVDNLDYWDAPRDCYPDVPDCIYSSCDEYDVSIVLEDLTLRGFRCPSSDGQGLTDGLSVDETRLAMKALARFHANGIEIARQLSGDGEDGDDCTGDSNRGAGGGAGRGKNGRTFVLPMLEKGPFRTEPLISALKSKKFFRRLADAVGEVEGQEGIADRLKQYIDNTPCLMGRIEELTKAQKFMKSYVFGDCWSNNFLFRYEENAQGQLVPEDVKMLDFQMCHYGLPQEDLHYFLNSGVSEEVRSKFEDILREDYYPELQRVLENLEAPFIREQWPFEKFLESYKATAEVGLVMAMIALPLTVAPLSPNIPGRPAREQQKENNSKEGQNPAQAQQQQKSREQQEDREPADPSSSTAPSNCNFASSSILHHQRPQFLRRGSLPSSRERSNSNPFYGGSRLLRPMGPNEEDEDLFGGGESQDGGGRAAVEAISEALEDMAREALEGESGKIVKAKFAEVVRAMVDQGAI